jgi:hypothetical protein
MLGGAEVREGKCNTCVDVHGLLLKVQLVVIELRIPEIDGDADREDSGEWRGSNGWISNLSSL